MRSFEFDFEKQLKFQFKEDALDVEIRNHKVNLSSSSEGISEFKGDNLRSENFFVFHWDTNEALYLKIQDLVRQKVDHSYDMKEKILKGKLRDFGLGLDVAWNLKRQFSNKISNDKLDELYSYAIEKGALGGKLLGAGGGGINTYQLRTASTSAGYQYYVLKYLKVQRSKIYNSCTTFYFILNYL
jgi:hypothetical protein